MESTPSIVIVAKVVPCGEASAIGVMGDHAEFKTTEEILAEMNR